MYRGSSTASRPTRPARASSTSSVPVRAVIRGRWSTTARRRTGTSCSTRTSSPSRVGNGRSTKLRKPTATDPEACTRNPAAASVAERLLWVRRCVVLCQASDRLWFTVPWSVLGARNLIGYSRVQQLVPSGRNSMHKAIVLAALAAGAAVALFATPSAAAPRLVNPSDAGTLVTRVADVDRPPRARHATPASITEAAASTGTIVSEPAAGCTISTSTPAIPRRATRARSTTPRFRATIAAAIAGTGRGWGATITARATGAGWVAATITTTGDPATFADAL